MRDDGAKSTSASGQIFACAAKLRICVLTKREFVILESLFGYGVYTAKATQLAKMVNKIMYSKGLTASG